MKRQLAQIGFGRPCAKRLMKTMLGQMALLVCWEPWSIRFVKKQNPPSSLWTVSPWRFLPFFNISAEWVNLAFGFQQTLYQRNKRRRDSSNSKIGNYRKPLGPKMDQMRLGWRFFAFDTHVDESPTGPDWFETDAMPAPVRRACGPIGAGRALCKDCHRGHSRPKGQYTLFNIPLSPNFQTALWPHWGMTTS